MDYYPYTPFDDFFFHLCCGFSILCIYTNTMCVLSGHKPAIRENGENFPIIKRVHTDYFYLFQVSGEVLEGQK